MRSRKKKKFKKRKPRHLDSGFNGDLKLDHDGGADGYESTDNLALTYSNDELHQIRFVGRDVLRILVTVVVVFGLVAVIYYVPTIRNWISSLIGGISFS